MPSRICRNKAILSECPVITADTAPRIGRPEQVKIAEDIEDLVASELVGEAQIGVDDLIVADDDAIVELAAADQSHGLEFLDVAQETESPRRRDLHFERLRTEIGVAMFLLAHRFGIAQNIVHGKCIGGLDANRLFALCA